MKHTQVDIVGYGYILVISDEESFIVTLPMVKEQPKTNFVTSCHPWQKAHNWIVSKPGFVEMETKCS